MIWTTQLLGIHDISFIPALPNVAWKRKKKTRGKKKMECDVLNWLIPRRTD